MGPHGFDFEGETWAWHTVCQEWLDPGAQAMLNEHNLALSLSYAFSGSWKRCKLQL